MEGHIDFRSTNMGTLIVLFPTTMFVVVHRWLEAHTLPYGIYTKDVQSWFVSHDKAHDALAMRELPALLLLPVTHSRQA